MKMICVNVLTAVLMAAGLAAAPEKPEPQPPPRPNPPHGRQERGNRGHWRIFADMSEEDRKAMRELQKNSPEEYNRTMKERAAAWEKKQKERIEKIHQLVIASRDRTDPAKSDAARQELREFIRRGYFERLERNERYVEELKKRAEHLEQDLERKRQKADQEIDKVVQMLIEDKMPPPRPGAARPEPTPVAPAAE